MTNGAAQRPEVGVATLIIKSDQEDGVTKLLLGKRLGKHAHGTWGLPGGKLEFGEGLTDGAIREICEEIGDDMEFTVPRYWTIANTFYPDEPRHFLVVFMIAFWESGEPCAAEPDKCAEWQWFDWHDLPEPLMQGIERLLTATVPTDDTDAICRPQWNMFQQRVLGDSCWPPRAAARDFVYNWEPNEEEEAE